MSRIARVLAVALGLISVATFAVAPVLAAVENVTGTLQLPEDTSTSRTAVAVITLTDRDPEGAGTIVGQQRIDGAEGAEIPFSVPFERDTINKKHAYSIAATIVDSAEQWQNEVPVPVITGGPIADVVVPLVAPELANPAAITGTITVPEDTELSPTAVAYAAIFNATTGRLVARQIILSPVTLVIPFNVPFDLDLIDPEASYTAAAAVIDGPTLWQTETPVAIDPNAPLSLPVAQRAETIPAPPAATEPPVATVTPEPAETTPAAATATPAVPGETSTPAIATPTPTPTATPTSTPTPTPTPTSTPTPTAPATVPATAIPPTATASSPTTAPGASATPVVVADQVTGTLVYREPYELSNEAYASVAVVQMIDGAVVVLGNVRVDNPGPVPIPFQVRLDMDLLDPNVGTELWAMVVDGNDAWVTPDGVAVVTNGAPSADVVVRLTFQPDLLEGQVTGITVGAGSGLSAEAVSMTWVLNATTLEIIGFDSRLVAGADPIPFAVPFSVADLDEGGSYIAASFVYDGESTWDTDNGTPVITQGNPVSDVTVTVAQITTPAPSASPSPIATPMPAPTPPADSGGLNPLWLLIALAVIVGLIVIFFVMRRNEPDETPPTDDEMPPTVEETTLADAETPPTDDATPITGGETLPADDTSDAGSGTGQQGGGSPDR